MRTAACNAFQHRALMPFSGRRLTPFWTTSKLFFAASQLAAFDLADKGGMMALLGDALFPDAATREYVTEELGGRLDVRTNYDTIDVTISGKTSGLERMIDFLRGAVMTTQLGADNVAQLKN